MKIVILLVILAAALGAGGGFLVGFFFTVFNRIHVDTQVACALLQTAETSGYISNVQRGLLVDEVVPPRGSADPRRGKQDWIRDLADSWWEGIREDQKSGCPDL
jgi:hypothetical protein